jgi:hypothetical protein
MSEVNMISAVTLIIKNMNKSCSFYSNIPGFKLIFGGDTNDSFTTYQIGKYKNFTFLNLELIKLQDGDFDQNNNKNISVELYFIQIMLTGYIHILKITKQFQTLFSLKTNLGMLHGRKILSHTRTNWISTFLCSAYQK